MESQCEFVAGYLGCRWRLQEDKGRATSYWGRDGSSWVLKRLHQSSVLEDDYLHAVANCLPPISAFRAGWRRTVLTWRALTPTPGGYWSDALSTWLDGAILMPRVGSNDCASVIEDLAGGESTYTAAHRMDLARRLAELILLLELADCSHRDLSAENLMVDAEPGRLLLIDWDSLYHLTLTYQPNTTLGTTGYIAPWLADGLSSWCPRADRFALAVCLTAILAVGAGTVFYEGSLFRQEELGRDDAKFRAVAMRLQSVCPPTVDLFQAAWRATSLDACPAPADWLRVLVDDQ